MTIKLKSFGSNIILANGDKNPAFPQNFLFWNWPILQLDDAFVMEVNNFILITLFSNQTATAVFRHDGICLVTYMVK